MSVYRRFFEIKDEGTVAEIERLMDQREEYHAALEAIKEEVGANKMAFYQNSGKFAGFDFLGMPNREHWRKVGTVWYPKKKSKEGKALAIRIEQLPVPKTVKTALKGVGLRPDFGGALSEGLSFHIPNICGSSKAGWFASVPWKDVDPEELAADKAALAAGERTKHQSILLWEPPAEWVEVKEWQVEKAMEEARAA